MATIQKFFLLDAATSNTGTMPSNSPTTVAGGVLGTGTDAAGAATARSTSDTASAATFDTDAACSGAASATLQRLGWRRFVSPPLAARTFASSDGSWTFHGCSQTSSSVHNGTHNAFVYCWRPSTGATVGPPNTTDHHVGMSGAITGLGVETLFTVTGSWSAATPTTILDGDILVFDLYDEFTPTMATAGTSTFSYNGNSDTSNTSIASYIQAPVALTLFSGAAAPIPDVGMALTVT